MTLLEKLLEIKKAIPYLKKENENRGQGFSYVSSSQVLGIFRQKCDELGIMVIPRVTGSNAGNPKDSKQILTELCIDYEIINVEDKDDTINIPFYAQGMDVGEKGVGKALTYGEKYLILKLFNIPTDMDDPDAQPGTTSTDAGEPAEVDEATKKFLGAMQTIRAAFKARDTHDNAVGMMTKVLGFEKDEDIKEGADRKRVVETLLGELGVTKVSELSNAS